MNIRAVVLVAVILLGAADDPKGKDVNKEMKKLEGTWAAKLFEHDEKPIQEDQVKDWKVVITGDKYTLTIGNFTEEGTWRIDASKKPSWVDVAPTEGPGKGQKRLGIYEVKGDIAKVCFVEIGKEERPKEFATKAGESQYLWEFKREKP
jgi:uncharacterized protein (TIGR03067 family)